MSQIHHIRETCLIALVEKTKPLYARWFKKDTAAWGMNRTQLKRYPPASLGKALLDFLQVHNIDLMPKLEDHDVLHVLLKYKTTVVDEARMQFFLLGNGKRSLYALGTALVALFLIPEHSLAYFQEFKKGRSYMNISNWDFRYLLSEPLALLRAQMMKKNLGEEAPFCM